jgi:hypothetical protein
VARIGVKEVQAWLEPTKLTIAEVDADLATQVEEQILSRVAVAYNTSTWVNELTTPRLIRSIIAMEYASFFIDRQYSEDERSNAWARRLSMMLETMLKGILDGSVDLIDVTTPVLNSAASFYPNDASSVLEPTDDDSSLGPSAFSMGRRF